MNDAATVVIRDYIPSMDDPLIYSSWTKNNWYSPKEPIQIPKAEWFKLKIKSIKQVLETSSVRVACLSDDPNVIAGYAILDQGRVLWVWVKDRYRRQGIAKLLTQEKQNGTADREPTRSPNQEQA